MAEQSDGLGVLSCRGIQTSNWYAWNNLMPPPPNDFHVIGDVEVPNPGVQVLLTERVPQGISPIEILLDIHLHQLPGIWPQIVVSKQARFDKVNVTYRHVKVFCEDRVIADLDVVDIE